MRERCPGCGDRRARSASIIAGRLVWHCYRCGDRGSRPTDRPLRPDQTAGKGNTVPGLLDAPTAPMLAWLGKYGVSWQQATDNGCWAGDDGRLWFARPGVLTGRSVDGQRPKWLQAAHTATLGLSQAYGKGATLVLCEDALAALKIGLAGGRGLAAGGTSVARVRLTGYLGRVGLLFDPDGGGDLATRRAMWALRAWHPVDLRQGREPKEHTLRDLQRMIRVLQT